MYRAKRYHKAKRAGFTLIELIMTVSIIAVLSLILFPSLQQYRMKVYDTAALSDATQYRDAVANADIPLSNATGWSYTLTNASNHPVFTEVKNSNGVQTVTTSQNTNGVWNVTVQSCSTNGNTGYYLFVPYEHYNSTGALDIPNEIQEAAAYRVGLCP